MCSLSSWTCFTVEQESSVSVSISCGDIFILLLRHAAHFISGVALYTCNVQTSTQQCASHYFNLQVNFELRKFQDYLRWKLSVGSKWKKNKKWYCGDFFRDGWWYFSKILMQQDFWFMIHIADDWINSKVDIMTKLKANVRIARTWSDSFSLLL